MFNPSTSAEPSGADSPRPCPGGFWRSQAWDSITSLGHLSQCSIVCTPWKHFLMFRWNLPCSSLCPLSLVLSLNTSEKSLVPFSLHPPFRYLYTLIWSPWESLETFFSRLSSLSSNSLSSDAPAPSLLFCPFTGLSLVAPCLSCTGGPRTGCSTPDVASSVLSREEGTPPLTHCHYFA